jgi:hypothetical protein
VDVRLRDSDYHPVDGESCRDVRIGYEFSLTVDPSRLVEPLDKDQQGDAGVGHQVLKRIQTVVAGEVSPCQALVVEHLHEPGRAALW